MGVASNFAAQSPQSHCATQPAESGPVLCLHWNGGAQRRHHFLDANARRQSGVMLRFLSQSKLFGPFAWRRARQGGLSVFLFLSFCFAALAQDGGAVAGVVLSSWDGSPLSTVTVTVRGTTLATQTDASGRFELKHVPPGDQVLRFSKSGYASAVVTDARVLPGQMTTVNGNLRPEFYEMEEYEVTAEEFTQQTEQIQVERQNSSAMMDAIGSEQFSKLNANDAGQIVARVTGVSVVGGKYAVVRGLSDRYTRTLLNGLEVPSADPYRTSPQLDLFPSAMIDRISVNKTFTPDQPGSTGGGTIDITTKSFPEKSFMKITFGISGNPNSNLRGDFLADPSSSMAMIAFPSGPNQLSSELWGLTSAPLPPGPASSAETPARATARANQANAVQGLMQALGTANFAGESETSPLNSNFDLSGGTTVPLFERNLGIFAGVNYRRNFYLINDGVVNRYNFNGSPERLGNETRGNIDTDYGANFNLGYELTPHSRLGFNFMFAHSVDEEARHDDFYEVEGRDDTLEQWQLRYTERQILNYQVNGQHELTFLADSKLDWAVGLANTSQDEPDNRYMNYYLTPDGQPQFGDAALPPPQFPSRYFRQIKEDGFNARVDYTLPLWFLKEDSNVKAGYFTTSTDRQFKEQYFTYNLSDGFDPQNPNSYLDNPAYLQYTTQYLGGIRTNYIFQRYVGNTFAHPYTGTLDVNAGYAMADVVVVPWLRLIGGARVEQTAMNIDTGGAGDSAIDQTDVLPALSAIINFQTNFSLRLSYGQTLARPSFREKAPIANFLPDLGLIAYGNPEVGMTAITSYDARLEWFPTPGDVLSAGVFYKTLDGPIELYSLSLSDDVVTWINRETSGTVLGVEFEARKSLEFLSADLKGLTLGVNVTLIESSTDLTDTEYDNKVSVDPGVSRSRPLYDQSPYIMNFDLTYEHPTSGTTLAIGANLTGERIVLVKSLGPDIYEQPPISLDAAISQRFGKHWTVKFGVRNILDSEVLMTYGSAANGDVYQSFRRGRTYGLSVSAEF